MPRLLAAVVICCALVAGVARGAPAAPGRARTVGLDVATLPPEQQPRYRLVEARCASCHSLARVLDADFTSPRWKAYLQRALKRPQAKLSTDDAQQIYEFLKWRSAETAAKH